MSKTERQPGERGNPVGAMRCWVIEDVSMECPYCGSRFTVEPVVLYEDALFFSEEFEQECPDCGKCFYAEVNDDDR